MFRSVFVAATLLAACHAFTHHAMPRHHSKRVDLMPRTHSSLNMFFADDVTPDVPPAAEVTPAVSSVGVTISPVEGDDASIDAATTFMVDSFWLNSPQQLIQSSDAETLVGDAARNTLCAAQGEDLMEKYGERLGKRLMNACLLTAINSDQDIVGMVGIEVCLLDKNTETIINADKAGAIVKNAVGSLGPKQRREFKDSSVEKIVSELFPPEVQAVCVLSNLAVSPNARRQGIAKKLCDEAERVASGEWSFNDMFLKVESENTAAKYLYEQKLGYTQLYTDKAATALRVDPQAGGFVEISADTLVLTKKLGERKFAI